MPVRATPTDNCKQHIKPYNNEEITISNDLFAVIGQLRLDARIKTI